MKQIKIQDLLPLLRKGWVAMEKNGDWWWYKEKPETGAYSDVWLAKSCSNYLSLDTFNIARFDGDWKDSLMECGK